jgi:hypothetical protein
MAIWNSRFADSLFFRGIEIAQDAPRAFQEALTDIGDGQAAGRTVEHAGPKTVFQRRNRSGDRRGRQAQSRSRPGKAACVGHGHKHLELVETIHFIPLGGRMNSICRAFLQEE